MQPVLGDHRGARDSSLETLAGPRLLRELLRNKGAVCSRQGVSRAAAWGSDFPERRPNQSPKSDAAERVKLIVAEPLQRGTLPLLLGISSSNSAAKITTPHGGVLVPCAT